MNKMFTFLIKTVLFTGSLCLGTLPLIGQPCVIDQPLIDSYGHISATAETGQSFTACATGVVTAIEVYFLDLKTKNLELQMASGTHTLTPDYTQTFTAKAPGKVLIQLTHPFPVQEYEEYAFSIVGTSDTDTNNVAFIYAFTDDPYKEGNLITEIGGVVTYYEADLAFNLSIVENACTIDQPDANSFYDLDTTIAAGQVFTACDSGAITMIRVNFSELVAKALTLQIASDTNTIMDSDTDIYTQDFQPDSTGDMIVVLSTPFLVDSGQTYAFSVIGLSGGGASLSSSLDNRYPPGNAFVESRAGSLSNFEADLDFTVTVAEDACVIDQAEANEFADLTTDIAVGQAFTACELGFITHIRIDFDSLGTDSLKLQMSSGDSTLLPEYTQVFSPDSAGDYLIQLTTPFRVEKDMPYAFSIIGFSDTGVVATLNVNNGNAYADGFAFIENAGISTPIMSDVDFSLLTLRCTPSLAGFNFTSTELTTTFINKASDADSVLYHFGDASIDSTSNDPNPTHTYADYGTYRVRQISYSRCLNDTLFQDVTLTCTPPSAGFFATANALSIAFVDNSSLADSVRYDFGDGITSPALNPTHTYDSAGTYTVSQIAYNSCRNDTVYEEITVTCPFPHSKFETIAVSTNQIMFKDYSSGADFVLYKFGDGDSSSNPEPSHTYANPGVFDVEQITYNNCGTDTSFAQLIVNPIDIIDLPQVITPNDDGINDFLKFKEPIPDSDLTILNRWGNQVYYSKPYQNDWGGTTSEGADIASGTYFYILRVGSGTERKTYRETVTIVR